VFESAVGAVALGGQRNEHSILWESECDKEVGMYLTCGRMERGTVSRTKANFPTKILNYVCHICMFACAIWWLQPAGPSLAQSTYGTIVGTVTDQTGAVLAGAQVEALEQDTGVTRQVVTDDSGYYRLVNLDAGNYTLTASLKGFATLVDKDIVLQARDLVTVNLQMKVQSGADKVIVEANQEILSDNLTHSTSRSGELISSLPLNFRATNSPSPIQTATLTPGVNEDQNGNLTFSGQLPTATSFSLDGISILNVRYGGPNTNLFPSVEGIAEFRVNTAGNSAEFAQPTDLTVITKSGTNDFHGSGFWYFTDKNWNATDGIARYNPTLSANTFGGSIAGPIVKNRLFFYFDYEGVRLDQNTLLATQTLPTSWIQGNFSGVSGGAVPFVLTDPQTGQPYNLSSLPVNATSAKIASLFFPAPTGPNASSQNIDTTGNNLNTTFPGHYSADGYDGRLDYVLSPRQSIFGRVTQHNITSSGTDATTAGALGAVGDLSYNPLMGSFSTITDGTNVAISYNAVINANLVNELRGGYTRYDLKYSFPQALQGNSIISELGITGLPGPPVNGLGGVPVFYVGSLMGGATNQYGHPRVTDNGIWQVGDNVTWAKGKITFKGGAEFRRINYQDNITFEIGDEYGDYYINGDQVCASAVQKAYPEACAAAQFVLGFLDEGDQAKNGPDGKPYGYHWDMFGQTEWKLRPNLTLTVGLRYELNTPFNDATNQLGQFDYFKNSPYYGKLIYNPGEKLSPAWVAAVGGINQFVLNTAVGLPTALRNTDVTNFQPRLGVAWNPTRNTVVRASAGMYSVPVVGAVNYSLLGVDTSNFGSYFPTNGAGSMSWSNVFGSGAAGPPPCPTSCPGYRRANQWNLVDPRMIQWNLGVEQNVGHKMVAKASYVGSHTYDLVYSPDLNQIPANTLGYWAYRAAYGADYPNFREVLTRANGPGDKYQAVILELNRQYGAGFTFTNAYTVTWNRTNALGAVPSGAIPVGGQGDNGANTLNNFDIGAATGNAFYDYRQKFLSTLIYQLPFGRGRKYLGSSGRATDLLLGGWQISGIILYHTGFWLTPYFPSSLADPSGTAPSYRSVKQQNPDCVAGVSGYLSRPTTANYFNVNAYTVPASDIGRFGNCGVGILEGPQTVTFSASLGKSFRLTERASLRYEAQFANLLNINNWGIPNMNVASGSSFGLISNEQDGAPGSQSGPRSIQMVLRLQF